MTVKDINTAKVSWGKAGLVFISLTSLFLVLKEPQLSVDYVTRGMKLCVTTLIPSLFPFMVISEIIVLFGAAEIFGKPLDKISRLLFGVSGEGASALVLGIFCGFPVGTRVSLSLYRAGRICRSELDRLICFSNNPSSAFVIGAVGSVLFSCRKFGVALYFTTIASSFLVGIGQNVLLGRKNIFSQPISSVRKEERGRGISAFADAVSSSALAMLKICGFVVFFSSFTGVLGSVLSSFGASQTVKAVLFSFFELSCGVASAAGITDSFVAALVAAFAVGWSGISVHFQMIGICDEVRPPLMRYFFAKLCQALINVLLIAIYLNFFAKDIVLDSKSVGAFLLFDSSLSSLAIFIVVLFFVCLFVRRK